MYLVRYIAGLLLVACTLMAGLSTACAQDIEPRAYSNAPVGVNFLIAGYAYTQGGVAFDPSLPVKDPQLETYSVVLGYARVLDSVGQVRQGRRHRALYLAGRNRRTLPVRRLSARSTVSLMPGSDFRSTYTERLRSR